MSGTDRTPVNSDDASEHMGAAGAPRRGLLSGVRGNKSSMRMLVMIGGAVGLLVLYFLFSGSARIGHSQLTPPPASADAQGGHVVPEQYRNDIRTADRQRAKQAELELSSAMPTVIKEPDPETSRPTITKPPAPKMKVITIAPAPIPAGQILRPTRINAVTTRAMTESPQQRQQDLSEMVAAMKRQNLEAVAGQTTVYGTDHGLGSNGGGTSGNASSPAAGMTGNRAMTRLGSNGGPSPSAANGYDGTPPSSSDAAYGGLADGDGGVGSGPFREPAAGSILYSQFLGTADSDSPGAVLGVVLQGPLYGARVIGSFATHDSSLSFTFRTMSVKYTDSDGQPQVQVLPINAVAVDPDQLGTAMATSVNRHLLPKIGLALGSAFLQAFGQAVASSGAVTQVGPVGNVVTTNPLLNTSKELYVAGGQAAGTAGQIALQSLGSMPTTIKVKAGTPFGLLFLGHGQGS